MKDIKDYLKVDPTSPSGLRWIKRPNSHRAPGDSAGSRKTDGYWQIKFNGKQRTCHALVMELAGPPKPEGIWHVDHINGDRADNRMKNLRWVTRSRNQFNREMPNATGHRWVFKNKNCSTYGFRCQDFKKSGFATAQAAYAAAITKRKELGLPIDTRLSTVH